MSLFQGIAAIIAGAQAEEAAVFTLLEQKAHTATTVSKSPQSNRSNPPLSRSCRFGMWEAQFVMS